MACGRHLAEDCARPNCPLCEELLASEMADRRADDEKEEWEAVDVESRCPRRE